MASGGWVCSLKGTRGQLCCSLSGGVGAVYPCHGLETEAVLVCADERPVNSELCSIYHVTSRHLSSLKVGQGSVFVCLFVCFFPIAC